ncbi:FAD/NAD(P)-binding domain-containing protein [Astrocystis sublimbata]|nr:FAD/NAD(P)-binding domain-containing protein [Astrocystis sublimbata]
MNQHTDVEIFDVVIVGAGISGINAAYHIQTQLPKLNYVILEARENLGGTWDLFQYPGIRSDTNLHNFGFQWNPWQEKRAIADGASIAQYLRRSAALGGIDHHIRFQHCVLKADWSSQFQFWMLVAQTPNGRRLSLNARFLILGSGYYDYHEPLQSHIPGLTQNFKGQVIHPQFWPKNLDYSGKRIVIIGSGATAITLLPNLAKKASHVTMLQRSPSYILSLHNETGKSWYHRLLRQSWAFTIDRWLSMWTATILYVLCRAFPNTARKLLLKQTAAQLPSDGRILLDPHFLPSYQPWDQRMCFSPNGDFYAALHSSEEVPTVDNSINNNKASATATGTAATTSIETGHIRTVTNDSLILEGDSAPGKVIPADIIITATGLKLGIGGGIRFSVDGLDIALADRVAWRAAMLEGVPNLAFMLGYINNSWTLGAETTSILVCRLLKHMLQQGFTSAVPTAVGGDNDDSGMTIMSLWNLDATYVKEAKGSMPVCGDRGPWKGRSNYFVDLFRAKYGSITDRMQFSEGGVVKLDKTE